jgi:hypothetical protein
MCQNTCFDLVTLQLSVVHIFNVIHNFLKKQTKKQMINFIVIF